MIKSVSIKKVVFILICFLLSSCITNYYYVNIEEDTPIYKSTKYNSGVITIIPKGSNVYLASSEKNYRKIKWNSYTGWVVNPQYSNIKPSTSNTTYNSSSNKTVHVNGYTRKDGTYVRPYTRSVPRRR